MSLLLLFEGGTPPEVSLSMWYSEIIQPMIEEVEFIGY